jgi:type II secretory pathway predicted ATPase ExeA
VEQREHPEHARSGRTRGAEAPLLHDIRGVIRASAVGKIEESHLLDNHQLEAIRLLTNHDMDLLTELPKRLFQL